MKGRGTYITEFRPGETITVQLNETVEHASHYRIAFNPNGDAFEDPTSVTDNTGNHPFVLLDNITDVAATKQSVQVTLPNVTCDNCTLQLIQVMHDKGGNGFGGADGVGTDNDDIYYACADLVLKGAPVGGSDAGVAGSDAGVGGSDAGVIDAGSASDAGAAVDAAVSPSVDASVAGADASVADAGTGGTGGLASDGGGGPDSTSDDDGCSLRPGAQRGGAHWFGMFAVAAAVLLRRRRR